MDSTHVPPREPGVPHLLEITGLKTQFFLDSGTVKAVDGVDLYIDDGEILGVVGESGCGKTVTARSILRLVPRPGRIVAGKIELNGVDLLQLPEARMREMRGRDIGMVFQEPMVSLNPVFRVGSQIEETLRAHRSGMGKRERSDRVIELLRQVGIPSPEMRARCYPYELSGGMRQRVMIAIALACRRPRLLIADEPTTALDVTIQAQILELFQKLQAEVGMSVMLITHDLGVVAETAQRVVVMYAGSVVESAAVAELFRAPSHPYTRGLLRSLPRPRENERKSQLYTIPGSVPNLLDLRQGCKFYDRCPHGVEELCLGTEPPIEEVSPGHLVRCRRVGEIEALEERA